MSTSLPLDTSTLYGLHIKTPQLYGIIAGCIVFTVTICVILYLFIASGGLIAFFEEVASGKKTGDKFSPAQVVDIPELYEHLLNASLILPKKPSPPTLSGRRLDVTPISRSDAQGLVACSNGSPIFGESAYDPERIWGWLDDHAGPFESSEELFSALVEQSASTATNLVIRDTVIKAPIGVIGLVSNMPEHLSIGLGNMWLTPAYQGKRVLHEVVLLVLQWLFNEGYRRVTVEVDSRHVIMRRFLQRCGFQLEAVLRKHKVVNRRNRDTALYVLLNSEWREPAGGVERKLKSLLGLPLKDAHRIAEIEVMPAMSAPVAVTRQAVDTAAIASVKVSAVADTAITCETSRRNNEDKIVAIPNTSPVSVPAPQPIIESPAEVPNSESQDESGVPATNNGFQRIEIVEETVHAPVRKKKSKCAPVSLSAPQTEAAVVEALLAEIEGPQKKKKAKKAKKKIETPLLKPISTRPQYNEEDSDDGSDLF